MNDLNFERDVLPVVAELAATMFVREPNRDELITDVISVAWELTLGATDEATPRGIVWYAVKRIKANRQFCESARSLTGPNPRRRDKRLRETLTVTMTAGGPGNPARIVEYRIDFRDWLNQLGERRRGIALMLGMGYTTTEVATAYDLSLSSVSGFRQRLLENWKRFRGH